MKRYRLLSLVMAALAVSVLSAASAVAQAPGSPVTLDLHFDSLGVGGTGSFSASAPLCPSGTVVVDSGGTMHTLTCTDSTGTFHIGFSGSRPNGFSSTWHLVRGTGAYAGVHGGGSVTSNTCTSGAPCDVSLTGTASLP
jgi:hypothetical protein